MKLLFEKIRRAHRRYVAKKKRREEAARFREIQKWFLQCGVDIVDIEPEDLEQDREQP